MWLLPGPCAGPAAGGSCLLYASLKEKPHPDAVQTFCGTSHISSFPRDHANKREAQAPETGGSLAVGFHVLIPPFFFFFFHIQPL